MYLSVLLIFLLFQLFVFCVYDILVCFVLVVSFLTKQAPTGHIFLIIAGLSTFYFVFNFNIKKILLGLFGSITIISIFLMLL